MSASKQIVITDRYDRTLKVSQDPDDESVIEAVIRYGAGENDFATVEIDEADRKDLRDWLTTVAG